MTKAEDNTSGAVDQQLAANIEKSEDSNIGKSEDSNIGKSEDSNIDKSEDSNFGKVEEWRGNQKYFQTGEKAGKLRPKYSGIGAARTADKPRELTSFEGLNVEALKSTGASSPEKLEEIENKKQLSKKAEKKLVEAKIASKMVMRILDTLVDVISKRQYGKDFGKEQAKQRNEYREKLEQDWQDYLQTLDIPMSPALVVAFGSVMYVGDAFNTEAGKERVLSMREKIGSKFGSWLFSRGHK